MSLFAEFDFVVEISNPALTRLVQRVQFQDVILNPPFELTLPYPSGDLHLIVNDIRLQLEADDWVTISFVFAQSSIQQKSPTQIVLCPLSGTLTIAAHIRLVPRDATHMRLALALTNAVVTTSFTPAAEQVIAAALAGSGVTLDAFKFLLGLEANNFVHGIPDIPLEMIYNVEPGRDGQLIDGLRFTDLQVRCIGHSDPNRQALCLLGNLLLATQRNGKREDKTSTAIVPGQDMATSISPGAFQALIFCPAVRNALSTLTGNPNLRVIDLPKDCGISEGLDVQDVTLTAMRCAFVTGAIGIFGSVAKSGTCYEASGFFTGTVKLETGGAGLVPIVQMDEPHIGVVVDWYCVLVPSLVLADITSYVLALADEIIRRFVENAKESVKGTLGKDLLPGSATASLGSNISLVQITPEGLTLQGPILAYKRPSDFFPSLSLEGSVTMLEKNIVKEDFWRTRVFCQQEEKDYRYTEYAQRQIAVYAPKSQLLATPLRAKYAVRGPSGPPIPLLDVAPTGGNTVEIPNVECTYPMPLSTGGTKVTQTVHLGYTVKGTNIRLRNRPEEGNFAITLEVSVLDCAGAPPAGIKGTEEKWIAFQGSKVEMGGEYLNDYQECMNILEGFTKRYLRGRSVPVWVKVDHPPEWQIFAQIRALKEMEQRGDLSTQEAADILLHTRIAHGESFARAYHSPTALQLGEEPEINQQAIALETVRAELTAQINNLTDLLSELERPGMLTDRMQRFIKRGG